MLCISLVSLHIISKFTCLVFTHSKIWFAAARCSCVVFSEAGNEKIEKSEKGVDFIELALLMTLPHLRLHMSVALILISCRVEVRNAMRDPD